MEYYTYIKYSYDMNLEQLDSEEKVLKNYIMKMFLS